jgi:hypothetical protein
MSLRPTLGVLFICLCCGPVIAQEAPEAHPDDKVALKLDGYTPAPQIVTRGESLDALIAIAKPQLAWNREMLWVRQGADRVSFTFGSVQWVQIGIAPPFWALLRSGKTDQMERGPDGQPTLEISNVAQRTLEVVDEKPFHDSGSGDYARIILHAGACDVYELGIESEGLGSGHPVDQRRLYVLHGPADVWRFVGEGPAESSGKNGPDGESSSSLPTCTMTGNANAPILIKFSTASYSSGVQEGFKPAFPDLEVHRDAVLEGSLPAKLRWQTGPYIRVENSKETLDSVTRRYVYWEMDFASEHYAKTRANEVPVVGKLVVDLNPNLARGTMSKGTIVHLPDRAAMREAMERRKQ